MKMDSPTWTPSRRKTLDVSRLQSSLSQPPGHKRHSWDPSSSRQLSTTSEKLAFIEQSLKLLKAQGDPLNQETKPDARFRSLTAASGDNPTKHSKWHHKNDTPDLNFNHPGISNLPPRFQRRHKSGSHQSATDRKSNQTGGVGLLLSILTVFGILGLNYMLVKDLQKGLCESNLTLNLTSLNATLRNRVFGQHLAVEAVPSLVLGHMVPLETSPLVMAFLGSTGVGKDYVASVIADHIRTKRRTVHKLIASLHLPQDVDALQLHNWIFRNLSSCAINLVIFDELENASEAVVKGIERVLTDLKELRLNSTRIVVVLISSSGGTHINSLVYDHFRTGISREDIRTANVLESLKATEAAQWVLNLHSEGLIDEVVPFLPLERKHVAQCIELDVETKRETCANPHVVAQVLNELEFFPQDDPLYSVAGCRRVGTKVDLVLEAVESGHLFIH